MSLTEKEILKISNFLSDKNKAVVIATDTIYGIISKSEKTIGIIKKRDIKEKKIIKLIRSIDQIDSEISENLLKISKKYWPGPLTIIYKGLGYRIPNQIDILKIIEKIGPVYASSANISGNNPINNIEEAKQVFKDSKNEIYYVKNQKINLKNKASTIFDLDNVKMIREGDIKIEELISLINLPQRE